MRDFFLIFHPVYYLVLPSWMDKIKIKNMQFFAYHGVAADEKKNGQKFEVDLTVIIPLKNAGQNDDLTQTIDYSILYDIVKTEMEKQSYNLIETVGENIASSIIKTFDVENVSVEIRKPHAPINGRFDYVAIEVNRP